MCFSDSGYQDTQLMMTLFSGPESVGITRFHCTDFYYFYFTGMLKWKHKPFSKLFSYDSVIHFKGKRLTVGNFF